MWENLMHANGQNSPNAVQLFRLERFLESDLDHPPIPDPLLNL